MPKIIHYRNRCIGCGICYELMPAYWRMSKKDGKATLIKAIIKKQVAVLSITESSSQDLSALVSACPVKVIKVH